MSKEKIIYCEECNKDITNDRVKPKNYCFDCCMKLGSDAESIFLQLIQNKPELIEGFKKYTHNIGLRTSALILD